MTIKDYGGTVSAPGPLLLLRSTAAAAAAAAAGESPHWHAGGDLELWSTGTLSQGTRSPLFPFSLSVSCALSLSLLPPSRSCHNICPVRVLEGDRRSGGARLMCHFRGRRFENRTVERPLTRGAESILRFVDDPAAWLSVHGGISLSTPAGKSFNTDILLSSLMGSFKRSAINQMQSASMRIHSSADLGKLLRCLQ